MAVAATLLLPYVVWRAEIASARMEGCTMNAKPMPHPASSSTATGVIDARLAPALPNGAL